MMNSRIRMEGGMGMRQLPISDLTVKTTLEEKIFTEIEIACLLDQIRKVPHRLCVLSQVHQLNDQLRQALKGIKV